MLSAGLQESASQFGYRPGHVQAMGWVPTCREEAAHPLWQLHTGSTCSVRLPHAAQHAWGCALCYVQL
jgi:hypothetical protein